MADAIFANGVNQIIWHGKPLNPAGEDTVKFYASVHLGKSGTLAEELPAFNNYLEKVSENLKKGVSVSKVAVYLPTEDAWMEGELPTEKQFIWAWGAYEHRYSYFPKELKAWRPMWINSEFLEKAEFSNNRLKVGDFSFQACYVDVKYMDLTALRRLTELAQKGLPVCLKQIPAEPGFHPSDAEYKILLQKLNQLKNVKTSWQEMDQIGPLITGTESTDFWCRETADGLTLFFANPHSQGLIFPLEYGQSLNHTTDSIRIAIHNKGSTVPYTLVFRPYQSLLIQLGSDNKISIVDIYFKPKTPVYIKRPSVEREKWEVLSPKQQTN